MAFRN